MSEVKPIVRICVPYPNHGTVKKKCLASLEKVLDMTEIEPQIKMIQGATIANQRNAGVNGHVSQRANQIVDFDYYLSIDSDIAFKPEDILQLINHDFYIVGGAYECRGEPDRYVAGKFQSPDCQRVLKENMLTKEYGGVQGVDWIGTGFLLIKKQVFEALEYPWFRDMVIPFMDEDGIKCNTWVGEDVGFCIAAQKAGYSIYADLDCRVEHLLDTQQAQSEKIDTTIYNDSDSDSFFSITEEKE
jgi:hypothetical protein